MKKQLALLLLVLLLPCLAACDLPTPPTAELSPAPTEEGLPPDPTPEPTPEPTREPFPDALRLSVTLPAASEDGRGLYYSSKEEYDCCFSYPDSCSLWTEDGTIRLSPSRFFARVILTPIAKASGDAPSTLVELFEPAKWESVPGEITVAGKWNAMRMSNTKYDTYRRWIAWETDDYFYLIYGVCFDRYEDDLNEILDVVCSSFRPAGEIQLAAPEPGTLLRSEDGVELRYSDASLSLTEGGAQLSVTLAIENGSACEAEFLVSAAPELNVESRCAIPAGYRLDWSFILPELVTDGSGTLELTLFARAVDKETPFAELPIRIDIQA